MIWFCLGSKQDRRHKNHSQRSVKCAYTINNASSVSVAYLLLVPLLLPIQCSPLNEHYRTIAHAGCDNTGAKNNLAQSS
jgi:hypothetical protein